MIKSRLTRIVVFFLCCFMLIPSLQVEAKEKITPSTKNYGVELQGAKNLYLCNQKAVDMKVGSKFFLTYTVTEIESDGSGQSGVIITRDREDDFPYRQGHMQYLQKQALLTEGRTYFFRFEMTKEGLVSTVAWGEGEKSDYVGFSLVEGNVQTDCKYFGAWFGDGQNTNMVGRLTRVRCYDEKGNDLGVDVGIYDDVATVYDPAEREALQPNTMINNKYSFTLQDASNVQISNRKITDSKVVYMEYTVKSVTLDHLTQSGMVHNYSPTSEYPEGFWRNEEHKTTRLLKPGVTYLIKYTVTDEGMDILLKYKENGKYVYFQYPRCWGESNPSCQFFTLWLGEGRDSKVSAEFVDFKCYDANGKNLGLQTNQNVEITHQGGLEDYSTCIAAYYNEEKDTIIWLQENNKVSIVTEKEVAEVTEGTYVINKAVLKITIGDVVTEYKYRNLHIENAEGERYHRLKNQKVKFISGMVSGDEVATITTTAETGYRVTPPETPTMEGNTFVAWCYQDGTEFNFEKPVTEATTLYAKWQDGEGNTFLAVDSEVEKFDPTWYIIGASCIALAVATVLGSIFIVKKWRVKTGGKNSDEQ